MTSEHITSCIQKLSSEAVPTTSRARDTRALRSDDSVKAPKGRLLIVSDRGDARSELVSHFLRKGFAVSTTARSETARTLIDHSTGYDLLLVELEELAGDASLLDRIQAASPTPCIIALVRPADLESEPRGLDRGVDDFVVRPLRVREVEVRVEALLHRRRSSDASSSRKHTIRDLTLDVSARTCYRNGNRIALTSREFDLLEYLFRNRGRTISRDVLAENVWETPQAISLRTIDRHITAIRQKIEDDPSAPMYLQTIYGKGYRFIPAE